MAVDITRKMTAKDRRIWRRREANRSGHSIRCKLVKRVGRCSCNFKKFREWGLREKAGVLR